MVKLFKIALAFGLASLIVGVGIVVGLFWHFSHGLPDHKQLADYQPATVSRLYAADGRLLMEYAKEKRVFVPVAAMPMTSQPPRNVTSSRRTNATRASG